MTGKSEKIITGRKICKWGSRYATEKQKMKKSNKKKKQQQKVWVYKEKEKEKEREGIRYELS